MPNPGPMWHARGAGDFYGTGSADILWQGDDGTPVMWEMNSAGGIIGGGALPNPGPSWTAVGTGDFNGDGHADILWQNSDGTPAIWEMNGTSIVGGGILPNPGPAWHVGGVGYFNGDGYADILWQNSDGTPVVWEMNGTSVAGAMALPDPGPAWRAEGVGDFFGNGHPDVLWQGSDGAPVMWEMNGSAIMGGWALPNPGLAWHVGGTGDFNADGRSDILWQNADGTPVVWVMGGTDVMGARIAGDTVSASQIVNNQPPAMAFVAPSDPVLTDPGQSLTLSGSALGGPADNQAFSLAGDNQLLNLFGATGNVIHVMGNADQVNLSFSGSQSVTDDGVGTSLVIAGSVNLTLADFQLDTTGSVTITRQGPAPTVQDDGHGGTLVAAAFGGSVIDFVGAHVSVSPVNGGNVTITNGLAV